MPRIRVQCQLVLAESGIISMLLRATLLVIASLSSASLWAATTAAPAVTRFTPQGELESVRQVTARFASDMVRLGDPRVKNPFIVDCVAEGKGRWVDTRNWAYDFVQDIPCGRACTFPLVKDQRGVAGQTLTGTPWFSVSNSLL